MRAVSDVDTSDFGVVCDERVADDTPPTNTGRAVLVGVVVQSDVVGEIEPLEKHSLCIGSVEVVVLTEEAGRVAGKINRETHCVQKCSCAVAMLCPGNAIVWQLILQPSVGGVADTISKDGETRLPENGDEIQKTGAIVDVRRLCFEDRKSIEGCLCSIAESVKAVQ